MKKRRSKKATYGKAMSFLNRKLHDVRVLIVTICVILAILLAVILGNVLGTRAKDSNDNALPIIPPDGNTDTDSGDGDQFPEEVPQKTDDIKADFCELTELGEGFTSSYSAISVNLRDKDGKLAFNSEIGEKYDFDNVGTADLWELVSLAESKGKYLSACFYLSERENLGATEQLIYRAYEAALIAEIASAGVDDVLIFGLDLTDKGIEKSLDFVKSVKELSGKTSIGVAVAYRDTKSQSFAYNTSRMYEVADYIAIDYSEYAENEEGFFMAFSEGLYYHARYHARVLLTERSTTLLEKQKSLLKENNINNYQIINRSAAG